MKINFLYLNSFFLNGTCFRWCFCLVNSVGIEKIIVEWEPCGLSDRTFIVGCWCFFFARCIFPLIACLINVTIVQLRIKNGEFPHHIYYIVWSLMCSISFSVQYIPQHLKITSCINTDWGWAPFPPGLSDVNHYCDKKQLYASYQTVHRKLASKLNRRHSFWRKICSFFSPFLSPQRFVLWGECPVSLV